MITLKNSTGQNTASFLSAVKFRTRSSAGGVIVTSRDASLVIGYIIGDRITER